MLLLYKEKKKNSQCTVSCPDVVKYYNYNMGNVDKHDKLLQLWI